MKPFTFMIVVLGLILAFLFAARLTYVVHPTAPSPDRIFIQAQYVPPERDSDNDKDDREEVEGLPVPIVPGTRVTEARILPPEAGEARIPSPRTRRVRNNNRLPATVLLSPPSTVRPIASRLSATVERARDDARLQLEREVTEWLTPEVPTTWKPPAPLITQMVRKTNVHPIVKDYGTVYETTLEADFSPAYRSEIVAAYHREVVARRLGVLGGILGFVLACLAAVAGYIRADEATRGYYTYWLRALAAAGVGASGVLIYQILT